MSDEKLDGLPAVFEKSSEAFTQDELIRASYAFLGEWCVLDENVERIHKVQHGIISSFIETFAGKYRCLRAGKMVFDNARCANEVSETVAYRTRFEASVSIQQFSGGDWKRRRKP